MKEKKLFDIIGEIEDRFIDEADPKEAKKLHIVSDKNAKKDFKSNESKRLKNSYSAIFRRRIRWGVCATLVLVFSLWLFIPFRTTPKSVAKYSNSEYYSVIQKLNVITFTPPKYKNNYEKYKPFFSCSAKKGGIQYIEGNVSSGNNYVETTDNQENGVIEGDIIKRSNVNIFYFNISSRMLEVYDINKTATKKVANYYVEPNENGHVYSYGKDVEMFLSEDLKTINLMYTFVYYLSPQKNEGVECTEIISLDVSNINKIEEKSRVCLSGKYKTSRMVDGDLFIMTTFSVNKKSLSFDKPMTYIPHVLSEDEKQPIKMSNIVMPESLTNTNYTVFAKFERESLEVKSFNAFLSYSDNVYFSNENLYLSREYTKDYPIGYNNQTIRVTKSEILQVNYKGKELDVKTSFSVDGSILNQYSLDEYDGNLRVVTTTGERILYDLNGRTYTESIKISASLFIVNLENKQIVARLENFAPIGETVQSVRFTDDMAYVCTAIIVTNTDPVFFIDLSDLNDVKIADSGVIDGYSSSLVDFGDNNLLGIGVNGRLMKIEVYEQDELVVKPICKYSEKFSFSQNYKSYFIDRQNKLIGLGVEGYNTNGYLLLHFDGEKLIEIKIYPVQGLNDRKRAVLINDYLYMFSERSFMVEKIF